MPPAAGLQSQNSYSTLAIRPSISAALAGSAYRTTCHIARQVSSKSGVGSSCAVLELRCTQHFIRAGGLSNPPLHARWRVKETPPYMAPCIESRKRATTNWMRRVRQSNPTGKTLLKVRNGVKRKTHKYFAFAA